VLALFGVGAVVVPAMFSGPAEQPATNGDAGTGAGVGVTADPTEEASEQPTEAPSPTVSAKSPTPRLSTNARYEQEVIDLVNRERARARQPCEPLSVDSRLTAAARGHSADMAAKNYFSHDGKDGSTPTERARRAGYPGGVAENIAAGQQNPNSVMNAWMNSSGHRTNILNCRYKVIGVGVAYRGRTPYWTQNFGAR
jgi:uncharacterized protein YkwD